MLVTQRTKYIEKIITSPEGVDFKVLFLVYEENGRIKAKVVSSTPLNTVSANNEEIILALPSFSQIKRAISSIIKEVNSKIIPSPYNSILYFNCTIPRAPAK
ncbi:MAG: hypothetical protein WCV55_02155 [Candidatus Paceibacterota bacterium]